MILPTKRLTEDRALISIGGEILTLLGEPKTVSRLWTELSQNRGEKIICNLLTFDWFVLALDFLYMLETIELDSGLIKRAKHDSSYI